MRHIHGRNEDLHPVWSEQNRYVLQMFLDAENKRARFRRVCELLAAWVGIISFSFLIWYGVARAL